MKYSKYTTIVLVLISIITVSCQAIRPVKKSSVKKNVDFNERKDFPFQKLTGNTDSILISKYMDDTTNFQKTKGHIDIRHMHTYNSNKVDLDKKSFNNIQKKRSKYPRSKISTIEEVSQWLKTIYNSDYPCEHSCVSYDLLYYKEVDDGFLIKGMYHLHTDYILPRCENTISWGMYLIGYDHNILFIKSWEEDPCPDKYLTNVEIDIYFPEFQNEGKSIVNYTKVSDCIINSFILENIKYPETAITKEEWGKVILSLTIENNGKISDITIVSGNVRPLDKEAVRCAELTDGKWISCIQQNERETPFEARISFLFVLMRNPKYKNHHFSRKNYMED